MSWYNQPDAPESVKHWSGHDPSDSGYCPECGEHLDSGRCECPAEDEQDLSGSGTCAGSRKACRKTSATHTGSETQADQTSAHILSEPGIAGAINEILRRNR